MRHPKKILAGHGLKPKKSLGQSFLFDERILERIVTAADLAADDQVLEIGPGLGSLTRLLADAANCVVAVELDGRFLPILRERLGDRESVLVVHGDILQQDPAVWFGDSSYKVVANVPYYITGAILRHLLSLPYRPDLMVLTVQKEVAERITAGPGDMTLLAMSVQFYGRPEIVGEIGAGAFWPRPDVDSAILRVDLHDGPPTTVRDVDAFFRMVRTGFSQKRKQLQKNLRSLGFTREKLEMALATAGIERRRRAETLSLGEWTKLFGALYQPDEDL